MSSLIENILNTFSASKERSMRIAELQSKLIVSSTPVDLIELNQTLQRLKRLLVFSHIGNDLSVSVAISVNSPNLFYNQFYKLNICKVKSMS